jgi:CheY-like chemotaxis protein
MMGGDLTVTSTPGQGSEFVVSLPARVAEAAGDRADRVKTLPAAGAPHDPGTGALALVIDDDPAARELLSRALVREGFRVETASAGADGLELARRLHPAVITLDVMMPGLDGWAVLGRLKSDPATADIPVVMVTVVDDLNLGFAMGAAEYLTKPLNWDRFHAVMARYRQRAAEGRVLVVEDEPQTRELVCRALNQQGWQVQAADNGRVALACLDARLPEVILLDLLMPEMDGFAFMRELRRRPGCRSLPVIVVTAKDLSDEDRRRLSGEVSQIVQKGSLSTDELVREIRSLLGPPDSSVIAHSI